MDLNKIPILGMLSQKMAWLGKRQRVLAENVANANTPGYKARDLERPDFLKMAKAASNGRLGLATKRAGHMAGGGAATVGTIDAQSSPTGATPSGNSVDLPTEMMKMGEAQMEYATATSLYQKHVKLIKIALGKA